MPRPVSAAVVVLAVVAVAQATQRGLGFCLSCFFAFFGGSAGTIPPSGSQRPSQRSLDYTGTLCEAHRATSNHKRRWNDACTKSRLLPRLIDVDPRFSEPLFFDFAQLVYTQLRRAPQKDVAQLKAYRRCLANHAAKSPAAQSIKYHFGSLRIDRIKVGSKWHTIQLSFLTNFERVGANDHLDKRLRMEQWTFRRNASLMSLGPEKLRSLGCPACGSNLVVNDSGRCPNCDSLRTDGRLNWVVTNISLKSDSKLNPIDLTLGGGTEPGVKLPTRIHGYLGKGLREMQARHPEWTKDQFRSRVSLIFRALQEAWSTQKWEKGESLSKRRPI